jgi:hypothetical protein
MKSSRHDLRRRRKAGSILLKRDREEKNEPFDSPSINAGAYLRPGLRPRAQPACPAYCRQAQAGVDPEQRFTHHPEERSVRLSSRRSLGAAEWAKPRTFGEGYEIQKRRSPTWRPPMKGGKRYVKGGVTYSKSNIYAIFL